VGTVCKHGLAHSFLKTDPTHPPIPNPTETALQSEVEALSLSFEQRGPSYTRLHTTKNGRASPPLSEGVRALSAAAARAVTAAHGVDQVHAAAGG